MLEPTDKRETYVSEEDRRAGNTDRDHYVERLKSAVATGHLTGDEFEARSSEALSAVTKKDLMVLVADIPEGTTYRGVKTVRVRNQIATSNKGNVRFSPWRWGITLFIGLTMVILPGPLFSAIFHGLDHAPASGGVPVMLIIFGVMVTVVGGTCFCPGNDFQEIPENNR